MNKEKRIRIILGDVILILGCMATILAIPNFIDIQNGIACGIVTALFMGGFPTGILSIAIKKCD